MQLPPLTLPATDGADICLTSLTGWSVVAIYPWTGRPGQPNPPGWDNIQGAHGSTPELEGFRDLAELFAARGIGIFGLSGQTTDYQREMAARLRLPFPILSDAGGLFAEALAFPAGDQSYLKRRTLLIEGGRIEHVFYPIADPARHAAEVLNFVIAQLDRTIQ
ncbi:MAG: peroxiredoxin [Methyloceanibacter sp.]|nr:peroxiredoxin [Methyloceanibacter sp.]